MLQESQKERSFEADWIGGGLIMKATQVRQWESSIALLAAGPLAGNS